MQITIFNEITTEGVIASIEENSKKYHVGFYADMNNAPERKLVKDSAADIGGIIKKLEAARISITKANAAAVNKEHASILERLKIANAPFRTLIDDYTAERKKVLDAEKARKQAILVAEQLNLDHEMALLMNKTYAYDKEQELKADKEHQVRVEDEALKKATNRLAALAKAQDQDKINAENARLTNTEHLKRVNNLILDAMVECEIPKHQAQQFIKRVARKEINYISINY